jgi:hypothetical protein
MRNVCVNAANLCNLYYLNIKPTLMGLNITLSRFLPETNYSHLLTKLGLAFQFDE